MNAVARLDHDGTSASERAYRVLAHRIATYELPAGQPFVEREEAARLGMSRTPFRDALNRLEHEGLVHRVPKRGTFVSPLDPDDIADNMAVGEAIEVEMALRAIVKGVQPGREFADAIEEQRLAISTGDHRGFLAADERFHMLIVGAAGNARAVETARRAWVHVNRFRYLDPMTTAAMRRARRDHVAIVAALRAGSADSTQAVLRRHFDEPLRRMRDHQARQQQ